MKISKMMEWLQNYSQNRLWILTSGFIGLILVLILGICSTYSTLYTSHKTQLANSSLQNNQKLTLNQLNRMETRLVALNAQLKENAVSPNEIKNISAQINDIQESIHKLKEQDNASQIQLVVEKENQKLFEKLTKVQKLIQQTKKQVSSHYLSSKALPFQVLGIDIWNGEPMATVSHYGESALMSKNDSRSGWTLIDLNFESSQMIFKNKLNQLVKVSA